MSVRNMYVLALHKAEARKHGLRQPTGPIPSYDACSRMAPMQAQFEGRKPLRTLKGLGVTSCVLGTRVCDLEDDHAWSSLCEECRGGLNLMKTPPVSVNLKQSPRKPHHLLGSLLCLSQPSRRQGTSGDGETILPRISSENYLKSQWWEWKNASLAF